MRLTYHSRAHQVISLVVLLGACSARQADTAPRPGAPPPVALCDRSMQWGGWAGSPECARIARTRIPASHLGCTRDEDCVLVGRSSCGANSVTRSAHTSYREHPAACGHPSAGRCGPIEFAAVCRAGCCNVGLAPTAE